MEEKTKIRAGCKDVWNTFMVEGAKFTGNDIPICPTVMDGLPEAIVTYSEAKTIYRKEILANKNFHRQDWVYFFEDDWKFSDIWDKPEKAIGILQHFGGIITPDYSTYQDFPMPMKISAVYRSRAFGYWVGQKKGLCVINSVRWGTRETWWYCFDGIPKGGVVAIGTVAGSPRLLENRPRFEAGLFEMARRLRPKTIIVYGSANFPSFKRLMTNGIRIIRFKSKMAAAFERRESR